jgi:NTP pyrophosphatase (non-canonical NTP hydrolase)
MRGLTLSGYQSLERELNIDFPALEAELGDELAALNDLARHEASDDEVEAWERWMRLSQEWMR